MLSKEGKYMRIVSSIVWGYDEHAGATVIIIPDGEIVAVGSRRSAVRIKRIARSSPREAGFPSEMSAQSPFMISRFSMLTGY